MKEKRVLKKQSKVIMKQSKVIMKQRRVIMKQKRVIIKEKKHCAGWHLGDNKELVVLKNFSKITVNTP